MAKHSAPSVPPEGWVECPIDEVTLSVPTIDPKKEPDRVIDYIDISSIDNTQHVIGSVKRYRLRDAPSRARQIVRTGDVLFSTVRPYLRNIASVPNVYDQQIASTGFAVLRPATGVCPAFLFYKVISRELVNAVSGLQYGVSYPAVKDETSACPTSVAPTHGRTIPNRCEDRGTLVRTRQGHREPEDGAQAA